MSNLIDQLITLDTDYYIKSYKDVQSTVKGMSEVDKKLWVLNHFVKYGYSEGRKYRLKEDQVIKTKALETTSVGTSTEPASLIDEESIIALVNHSQQKRSSTGEHPVSNYFWEL